MASQMPSTSRKIGRIRTLAHWNTKVRRKEMAAEASPLFSAVKKDRSEERRVGKEC